VRRCLLAIAVLAGMVFSAGPARVRAQRFRGPPPPDRIFSFLDRNGSGTIEPDEIGRIPAPMREWLSRSGTDLSQPIPRDRFLTIAPQMMQAIRSGRSSSRRLPGNNPPSSSAGPSKSRSGKANGYQPVVTGSEPKPRSRVTVSLPDQYRERDQDDDGQIGLYEWKQWNRAALAGFFILDRNSDGFLTPRELVLSEGDDSKESTKTSTKPPRLVVVKRSGNSGRSGETGASGRRVVSSGQSSVEESPETRRARYYFSLMDKNRDGSMTDDEWAQSRRIRPLFERAGIDISKPMSMQQFVENYVRVMESFRR